MPRRAMLSCSDKQGLVEFASALVHLGFELLSTGGTRAVLEREHIPVTDVSSYTEFPEMMDGRVKTLHPRVHGGLLGRPDLPTDRASMDEHGITPIELVVVNLYPFVETISRAGVTLPEAVEQIDIGGPSMLRSAAKNHRYVGVVTSNEQYDRVLDELQQGGLSDSLRFELAAAAFEVTARYDRAIADYLLSQHTAATTEAAGDFPDRLELALTRRQTLRYGENPHQRAAFYVESKPHESSLAASKILHGKELSYNNLLDLDAAMLIVREYAQPTAVVIKHNNPCGCATAPRLADAYEAADAGDPVSAFGSILGFNRVVDVATADRLSIPGRFIEAIIAPGYEPRAFELLTTVPKWKGSVRLLECAQMLTPHPLTMSYRTVSGGLLMQERDEAVEERTDWRIVTTRQPTEAELADLAFAWPVCKHVKSNAILIAKEGAVLGVGAGQMSRLDSAWIATRKAGDRSRGAVCASDAFFPFRDGVDQLAAAGVTAIIQPGGSRRDDDVIAACNEHQIAMIFTGRRHFLH